MSDTRKLRQALKVIAEIPLWGEPLKNEFWKNEAIKSGEYNVEADGFTPTLDTVANYLYFAVKTARAALKRR